jgi:hypothetical protein
VPPESFQFRADIVTLLADRHDDAGSMYPEFEGDPAYEHACEQAYERLSSTRSGQAWIDADNAWQPRWSPEQALRAVRIFGEAVLYPY